MTKRLVVTLALALIAVGCGPSPSDVQQGVPVRLLTDDPNGTARGGGCFTASASGRLVVDPTNGTAIVANGLDGMVELPEVPVAVAWRPGFTGRRIGSEVEVFDPQGKAVAITGRNYLIPGGYIHAGVFWACGDVQPLP